MNWANEEEQPKIRFIRRDGVQILQERVKVKKDFEWFEVWKDVETVEETTEPKKLDTFTYD